MRQDNTLADHRRSRKTIERPGRRQRTNPRTSASQPPVWIYFSGAGTLSLAHRRTKYKAAAGDHGLSPPTAEGTCCPQYRARQFERLRKEISLAAVRWHAAARIDCPCPVIRPEAFAHGRALRRPR